MMGLKELVKCVVTQEIYGVRFWEFQVHCESTDMAF